jgi:hypothetical protein
MALDYISSLTTLFGASAVLTGTGATADLDFIPYELNNDFGAPETAKPEAFILAILQKAFDAQGVTSARAMEVTRSNVIAIKDGDQVNGEQYVVRIFSGTPITPIDPDTL